MKHITRRDVKDVLLILAGCMIGAAAFSFLTFPNSIVSGGLTGIAQILNLLTGLPVGVMVIVMNIPLFLVAWRKFGTRFIIYSAIGMAGTSIFIDLLGAVHVVLTHDMLLAAIFGGVMRGLGAGLIYWPGASAGGSDIGARLLRRKYPHINYGTLTLGLYAVVVAAFAIVFRRVDSAMYTIITMFVSSKVVNLILYGLSNSGICYIITIKPQELSKAVLERLGRGCTILRGEGAYSGEERDVLLCAVKQNQIPALRRIVTEIDPRSFVIVTQSHEVFGKNFDNISKIE